MTNFKILTVFLLLLSVSCEQVDEDILSADSNDNSEEPDFKNQGSIPVLSNCRLGDINLFDAPVNRAVRATPLAQNGMRGWKIVSELSDEFNYKGGKASPRFQEKWKLGYVNAFTPLPTVWTGAGKQVTFEDDYRGRGNNRLLVLQAEIDKGNQKRLLCGMISSLETSSYPLFQEASVRISNSQLANAVWMISKQTQIEEIDNLEAYGPRIRVDGKQVDNPYFANRLHLSHHTFRQTATQRFDYQPKKDTWMSRKKTNASCSRLNDVVWSEKFHTFGVLWKSPTELVYFVDGKKVKTVRGLKGKDGIDPRGYTTCGKGLTREMHMLISQAAQPWRYGGTDAFFRSKDIKSGPETKMFIDWIRVYSPNGKLNKRACK
ncbi:family 16 glycosylhydrolase [Aquimarina sp. ERC-38]|uniref:family 16 glycosylhydrolase n=1 Tax=Aquimarina sp. ERC-38 TaxID=2949996 RepID=UPI0022483F24|nr:family 16 glycosylhydrolase [Aquimarina sp. ERC-38]UZO82595.1 family 16 glycosylhydrolase [Aquimarina sp. ERC-38]